MSAAGLAEAFGHVSARWKGGFAITSTLPFAVAGPEGVVVVPDAGDPPSGGAGAPLETPMHAAVYLARPDVGAICRGHPPAVVAWGTGIEELPLLHGLGALAGTRVWVHPDTCRQNSWLAIRLPISRIFFPWGWCSTNYW